MRPLAIIACLALPLMATASSSDSGFGSNAARAEPAADAANTGLAHEIDLAERAARRAREAEAAREARKREEAERAEQARREEQDQQAEQAAKQEAARRKAAFALPPLPRQAPAMGSYGPQEASDWKAGHKARVRMIAGEIDFLSRGWSLAGVQMEIDRGWKTYWRTPGDTGFAPTFDWSGSRNLKSAEVLFPAPRKYRDEYSTSVGYKHEVVLPVRITAIDPGKPVDVQLRFGYGLCEQICVPGEAELRLVMPPRQSGRSDLLARYTDLVPRPVERLGQSARGFAIDRVDVQLDGEAPAITIDARVPADAANTDLFIEASGDFYLPLPSEEGSSGAQQRRYRIDLTRADPAASLPGRTLSMTLVGDTGGIEYRHKIN